MIYQPIQLSIMTLEEVTVVTTNTNNEFVTKNADGELSGICMDLWMQVENDLNLRSDAKVMSWEQMYKDLNESRADVIMQRINDGQMIRDNVKK